MNKTPKTLETKVKKKRGNIIRATMSVAHVDDDDNIHVEKVFPNGDIYTGQWANSCPSGHGKCLWADGCMYVGNWSKGKTLGKGKFSWPSGATYEGQFKNGDMEGEGVYTGSSYDTYRGTWLSNMRHGKGVQSYDNWRQGKVNGIGRMNWGNGNQYDGNWQDGLPTGNGTFRWADGSFYVGVWSEDPREQRGTYYTSSSQKDSFDRDPHEVYVMNLSCSGTSPVEKIPVFPCQKLLNWPCDGHKNTKERVRNGGFRFDSASDSTSDTSNECSGSEREADDLGVPHLRIRPAKTHGNTISKGHKHYELMLNLQLGIRHSVGRPAPVTSLDLKASAFDPRDKIWTKFPPEGSKHTPPHHSCDFKWKDYCPLFFRTLRKLFKLDPGDYMMSICGNDALRELSSPGKSGSSFYLTSDDKYMIKTMKKSEVKVLKRMLPAYYNHVRSQENTLVTKFYGLHCVRMTGPAQKKVRFVIMGNLFCTEHAIHRRFDLKGSSLGRSALKPECEIDSTTTLKDLDLNFIFRLQKSWFQEFCRQVNSDCDFLEQERIMDYSLLVGIHFREISHSGEPLKTSRPIGNHGDKNSEGVPDLDTNRWSWTRLGSNMPARAELTMRRNDSGEPQLVGEPTGEYYDVVLAIGIIDILQDYDISKKLEHAYKSFQYDATSISAVDPRQYSKRFRDFIFRIFTQAPI